MVQSMEQIDRIGMLAAIEKAIDRISRDVDGISSSLSREKMNSTRQSRPENPENPQHGQ